MGFIRLDRKFFENAYWKQERTFSFSEAWLDLIQMARFDEEPTVIILPSGRQITIKRGEMRASLRFLSFRWGWGVEKTKRFIDKHIEKHEVERRIEQGETVLMLCKYDIYNPISNADQYADQYSDQYTDRTVTDTPTSTKNKNIKKEEESKERGDSARVRAAPPTKEEIINKLEERKSRFKDECAAFLEVYGKDMLNAFFVYWTEPNKSRTKMRFELEKTWDLRRRLTTWSNNESKFSKNDRQSNQSGRANSAPGSESLTRSVLEGIARAKTEERIRRGEI